MKKVISVIRNYALSVLAPILMIVLLLLVSPDHLKRLSLCYARALFPRFSDGASCLI